jgi:hypothetical protein
MKLREGRSGRRYRSGSHSGFLPVNGRSVNWLLASMLFILVVADGPFWTE